MSRATTVVILALAALLETGGDALMRAGLRSGALAGRWLSFALGALLLFCYGWTVNAPPWDFGRLIGLYIVFFFITAQVVSWLVFGQPPSPTVLIGGALVIAGGVVIVLGQA